MNDPQDLLNQKKFWTLWLRLGSRFWVKKGTINFQGKPMDFVDPFSNNLELIFAEV